MIIKTTKLNSLQLIKNKLTLGVRIFVYIFLFLILIILSYLNFRLYYTPTYIEQEGISINEDVQCQLNYLKNYLHNGAGKVAQSKYPEGFVFINVLYGLAWCDFIANLPATHLLRKEGTKEIDWALKELNTTYAAELFPSQILPSRGIFYVGWKNYLLGKKLGLQDKHAWNPLEIKRFKEQCASIYAAYQETKKTYLASYRSLAWPADNVVGVASLALYNQIDSPKYSLFIKNWIKGVKQKLDPKTGLIPHEVNFDTEKVLEGAKGSSQSLMLNFLLEIDASFAKEQFEQYKAQFLDARFGLPGIREYPQGTSGLADVDSGPVLLDIGGSASLVGQRTMARYGATITAIGLRNSIESFGVAYTTKRQKKYVLGLEPIADAFIVWANVIDLQNVEKTTGNWRGTFQLLSLGMLFLIVLLNNSLFRKQKKSMKY